MDTYFKRLPLHTKCLFGLLIFVVLFRMYGANSMDYSTPEGALNAYGKVVSDLYVKNGISNPDSEPTNNPDFKKFNELWIGSTTAVLQGWKAFQYSKITFSPRSKATFRIKQGSSMVIGFSKDNALYKKGGIVQKGDLAYATIVFRGDSMYTCEHELILQKQKNGEYKVAHMSYDVY